VRDDGTTKTKKPQLDASNIEAMGGCFIEDMEIVDSVCPSTKFFEDKDILAGTPNGEYGHRELKLTREEKGKFGKKGNVNGGADCLRGVFRREEVGTLCGWY